jgi:hypothetical protein
MDQEITGHNDEKVRQGKDLPFVVSQARWGVLRARLEGER